MRICRTTRPAALCGKGYRAVRIGRGGWALVRVDNADQSGATVRNPSASLVEWSTAAPTPTIFGRTGYWRGTTPLLLLIAIVTGYILGQVATNCLCRRTVGYRGGALIRVYQQATELSRFRFTLKIPPGCIRHQLGRSPPNTPPRILVAPRLNGLSSAKTLDASGIELSSPPRQVPNSKVKIAFLTDPWGTYIELTENLAPTGN